MTNDSEDQQPDENENDPEVYVAAGVISSGPETGAIVAVGKIKARDLTDEHVGQFVAGYDPKVGANVPAKILRVQHVNEGKAPGVLILARMSALPDGTPSREERWRVPFDHEFDLVDMLAY
jgi:hypothetical protein